MRAAQLNISLLGTVVIAVGIPAAFHISNGRALSEPAEGLELTQILAISRGIAVLMLLLYVAYLLLCVAVALPLLPACPDADRPTLFRPRLLQHALHARPLLQERDADPAPAARGGHARRRAGPTRLARLPPARLGPVPLWLVVVLGLSLVRRVGPLAQARSRRRPDARGRQQPAGCRRARRRARRWRAGRGGGRGARGAPAHDHPGAPALLSRPSPLESPPADSCSSRSISQAFVILFFIVVLTGVTAEFLIGSIDVRRPVSQLGPFSSCAD